jgi:hypothetical protein
MNARDVIAECLGAMKGFSPEYERHKAEIVLSHLTAHGITLQHYAPWSSTPPTVPGAYWWRLQGDARPIVRDAWRYGKTKSLQTLDGDIYKTVKTIGGEWCGPITPPEK